MPWNQTSNDDNGSLFTGALRLREGDHIQIRGEPRPRRVSYVMGSDREGWRACTKGYGAFPYGPVAWRLIAGRTETPPPSDGSASARDARPPGRIGHRSAGGPLRQESDDAEGPTLTGNADAHRGRSGAPPYTEDEAAGVTVSGAPAFDLCVGIDYSGAKTPTSSLRGLRVYFADQASPPAEVQPPPSPRRYWTRRGIAEWLVEQLRGDVPTLVGMDHGFSFPLQYFETHQLPLDWDTFLDDFQRHWPTDEDHTYVDFVRDGTRGNGAVRSGDPRWRRLTEVRAGAAKSVFHFDVPGSVAKSTHAGLPWLRYIRQRVGDRVHFWPFDGWDIPARRSVMAEVYPSLWSQGFDREERTPDQHDAYSIATWIRRADLNGSLAELLDPDLAPDEREVARIEGWILGVR